jgi:hypothetical protein
MSTYNFLTLLSFEETVQKWLSGSKTRKILTRDDYNKIKNILINPTSKIADPGYRHTVRNNYLLQKIGNDFVVLKKNTRRSSGDKKPLLVKEDLYKIFCEAHLENNHGGQAQTWKNIKKNWVGVKQDLIEDLVKKCITCANRKTSKKPNLAAKPILASGFMSRIQVIYYIKFRQQIFIN